MIVNDIQITAINQEYLHHEGPTNVISFPMQEGDYTEVSPFLLGDVVISIDTAEKEAIQADISVRQRLIELLIHGMLHLAGYHHETSPDETQKMEARSKTLLERVQQSIPKSGVRFLWE